MASALVHTAGALADEHPGLGEILRLTLARNPSIRLQQAQLAASAGIVLQRSGSFDEGVSLQFARKHDEQPLNAASRASYTALYGSRLGEILALRTDTTTLGIAVDKTLRNGVVLSGSASASRLEGTSNDIAGWSAQNLGLVRFAIDLPLLRGGGTAVAAPEQSADLEWQASRADLKQTTARQLLNSTAAYWRVIASERQLAIAREGEASTGKLEADTRRLIAADELPAAEIQLVQATLAERQAARLASEQAALLARHNLAAQLGVAGERLPRIPLDSPFPAPPKPLPRAEDPVRFVALAREHRADIQAARLREEAARLLTRAASDELRPRLDLGFAVGYAGLSEGNGQSQYLRALRENTAGPNAEITLSYRWSVGNRAARGQFEQQAAYYDQASLSLQTLARNVELDVIAALAGLMRSASQLHAAEASVATYRISLENEKTKNRLGMSTLLNVLSVDDRLRNARLNQVSLQESYLNALAALAFETGLLIGDDGEGAAVDPRLLTQLERLLGRFD